MQQITGTVARGKGEGRTLGFPTANVISDSKISIDPGIYSGKALFSDGSEHQAALYIREDGIIEAYLLDFSKDIYEQNITVSILEKVRDTMKFKNSDEAMKQIRDDVSKVREYFNRQK